MDSSALASARVDSWIWAVRLVKTRSLAQAACKAGHVSVNGEKVKPAHQVRPGDEIRIRGGEQERIVTVVRLIVKRVSAVVASGCLVDNTPPPLPRVEIPQVAVRDRGAGRPTKRDRREIDRLIGE